MAVKHEETTNYPLAQLGFGFYPNGSVRVPQKIIPRSVAIVDDMHLPNFTQSALEVLKSKLSDGCIFDFEQNPALQHKKLISAISKVIALPAKFHEFAPKALPIVSCPEPCNHWQSFLRDMQRSYPRGWMLEITPWMRKVKAKASKESGFLQNAICRFEQNGGEILYFDTRQTIMQKLSLAQKYGCRAAIGFLDELRMLK